MMIRFLIRHRETHRYVERRPYDGALTWLATDRHHATGFETREAATQAAAEIHDGEYAEIIVHET